ncbi:MAG: hypothetical protein UV27_C0022G0014 [candidate division WWE3 bacterium GW2011_GWA1_42_46]|nr:MAG: hypothetical protein UV27_C0022G0014 [candidate division WWE3 bacterium GW2011_GWA1_42_46]
MKNKLIMLPILVLLILLGVYFYQSTNKPVTENQAPAPIVNEQPIADDTNKAGMSNPASDNCITKGGTLEIITESDGSQFGLCKYECDIEGDALKIREALIAKGLDLSKSEIVIKNHLGKYISGSVNPIDEMVGGGYFFAVKEGDIVKVLADGNGSILCSSFKDYPDYSSYLIPECYDEVAGKNITR